MKIVLVCGRRCVRVLAVAAAVLPAFCQSPGYLITTVAGGGLPITPVVARNFPIGQPSTTNTPRLAADSNGNFYFTQLNCMYKVDAAGVVSRVAGSTSTEGFSGDGGPAINAQFSAAGPIAVDSNGNLYILDEGNNVRKVTAATGIIATIAGNGTNGFFSGSSEGGPATSAQFSASGIAVDGAGNLFISEIHRVLEVEAATGIIMTVAGDGTQGFSGDGGPATSAQLFNATRVAADAAGNIFILDSTRIREVNAATGIINTVAGNGVISPSPDGGPATSASLDDPTDVAVDGSDNVYIVEFSDGKVRKGAAATGIISTVASRFSSGFSGDGGPATSAQFSLFTNIAVDGPGNLYIADVENNHRIREVAAATGIVTTVAGNGQSVSSWGEGGPATLAQLEDPSGAVADSSGNLYIADTGNNLIRKVALAAGIITTIAGAGTSGLGDGGPATSAALDRPSGVALDGSGNLYIADTFDNSIRMISRSTGIITTVAGGGDFPLGDGGPATSGYLNFPAGVAVDSSGNIYIADTGNDLIRKVTAATGIITTVAGVFNRGTLPGFSGDGGQATSARLNSPMGVAVDGAGNIYIADTSNGRIREVTAATGIITTVAGGNLLGGPGDGGPATNLGLLCPSGVAVDGAGNLYIADGCSHAIRGVAAATGIVTTIAGTPAAGNSGDGSPVASEQFNEPQGVSVDNSGNVYVADFGSSLMRMLAPSGAIALLGVTKTHAGDFAAQSNATYSITVSNTAGAGPTTGGVTVSEMIPAGLTLQSMWGDGWNCAPSGNTCTRSDVLNGGASYPPLTVNVGIATGTQVVNQVSVVGGGSIATTASDTATVTSPLAPIAVVLNPPVGVR